MEWLRELNLREVAYLVDKFGLKKYGNNFSISKPISTNDVFEAQQFIEKEIWNPKNIERAIGIIKNEKDGTVLHYWKTGVLEPVDDFIGRAGILDYTVIMADTLSTIAHTHPTNENSIQKDPESYVRIVVENALFLFSVSEWIQAGHLLMIPEIMVWDWNGWMEMSKLNEELHKDFDFDNTPLGQKYGKLLQFEAACVSIMEMQRLTQNNAQDDYFTKGSSGISLEDSKKALQYLKGLPKRERDIASIKFAGEYIGVDEYRVQKRIAQYEKQSVFHLDNYLDISKLTNSLMLYQSMPLTHALHISNTLDVIPITDKEVNKWTFDIYAQFIELSDEYKKRGELTESEVELKVAFIENLTSDFVKKHRTSGAAHKYKAFLDKRWEEIRNKKDSQDYVLAMNEFSKSVNGDYQLLKNDLEQAQKTLFRNLAGTGITAGGALTEEVIRNDFWMGIAKSIPILFAGALKSYTQYDSEAYVLKKNPLFIFLGKE